MVSRDWAANICFARVFEPSLPDGQIWDSGTVEKFHEIVVNWPIASFELTSCYEQMMFVSGETAEPSTETTGLIEDIVRQQVVEMVSAQPLVTIDLKS